MTILEGGSHIIVHPRRHALGSLSRLQTPQGHGERDASDRLEDEGELAKAVRPYRSGDAMRRIHWKSTARTGELVVRESEGDAPSETLTVVLDDAAPYAPEAFELAVETAASLLTEARRLGLEARLLGQASEPRQQSLTGQLDWLAHHAGPPDAPSPGMARRPEGSTARTWIITSRPEAWPGRACIPVTAGTTLEDVRSALS